MDAGSGFWGGAKSLQRVVQAHHMDETKQSRQVAGEAGAGPSTIMPVMSRDSHPERRGHVAVWEGSGGVGRSGRGMVVLLLSGKHNWNRN